MVSIGISIDGGDALAALDLMSAVDSALLDAGNVIASDARGGAPQWTGQLSGSIEATPSGEHEVTVAATAPYAPYVHGAMDGGGSRSVPHWPPKGALQAWADDHGIPEFLVRRAIAQRGTPLVRFLADAATADADQVVQMVGDAIAQAIGG